MRAFPGDVSRREADESILHRRRVRATRGDHVAL
jgi:hypothetical protein